MNGFELALQLLPPRYLDMRCRERMSSAEELRLRLGQPLMMLSQGREYPVNGEEIEETDLLRTLEKATGASLHTVGPSLSRGYISYHGLRIGVCGTVVEQDGQMRGFRRFSSLAIRIPKECRGILDQILRQIDMSGTENILIISPPGVGKTTALRELVRQLSERGWRIGVVDERWEIAAAEDGKAQFSLGKHCDVISGVRKAQGAMMLLRGMNPQMIAMDEITAPEDVEAIREITGCGVGLLATAHAASLEDLSRRPLYRSLLDEQVFHAVIEISQKDAERCYQLRRIGA